MRTTHTGKSILENILEVIAKMDDGSIERFKKGGLEDRKQPAYIKLFQHLFRKIQKGIVAEAINESGVKRWVEKQNRVYDDLIANLYKRLLEFLGSEFAHSQEEQWHRRVDQKLDEIEALLSMRLFDHAFPMIEVVAAEMKVVQPDYNGKWSYTLARFVFVKSRWQHLIQDANLPWVGEINRLVKKMGFSEASHSRKNSEVPKTDSELKREWSGSAIFLRLRYLHAEHYGDYQERIQSLESYLAAPTMAGFRETTKIREKHDEDGSHLDFGYAGPMDRIEQLFIRLIAIEYASLHGDLHTATRLLNEPYEVPPARILYPACNLWAVYQFYGRKAAFLFSENRESENLPLDRRFLEKWQDKSDSEIENLPFRMELHQILIHYGSGRFEVSLELTLKLLKQKRKNRTNPDLRMIEVLAMLETGKELTKEVDSLNTMIKKQKGSEWEFVKSFAKMMLNPPFLKTEPDSLIHEMKGRAKEIEPLFQSADETNPSHQLILWRISRWGAGEGLEWRNKKDFGAHSY